MKGSDLSKRHFMAAMASAVPTAYWLGPIAFAASAVKVTAVLGQPAPSFEVIDASNKQRALAEFKGKPVVLEWSSPSCPFAKAQYVSGRMPGLQKWATENGIVWLTVLSSHPSRSDYLEATKAGAFNSRRGGVPTALLIDATGDVGHAYGAKTANPMFVVDGQGVLVYAGGIDDGETMNPQKVLAAHNYVRPVLEDVLAQRAVRTAITSPFGCSLAYAG
ncbi:thioredoxin family protein [soil metagenome]